MDSFQESSSKSGNVDRCLFEATSRCSRKISECLELGTQETAACARALQQLLEMWARHSGVRAREGLSLDDRLKDRKDLKDALLGLLNMIHEELTKGALRPLS